MVAEATQGRTLVLVHGAWHKPWCWERLVPELTARGWRVTTPDMPSSSGDPEAGMYADAQALREHLAGIDGPITVLAHSYGGMAVSEVADTFPNVTQLIYLAAHMLDVGESVVSAVGIQWFGADETLLAPPDPAQEILFADVPAEIATAAAARLQPQSAKSFLEPNTRAAWQSLPTAYVVCDQDASFPEVLTARLPQKADLVRHVPASHSPFLSRPAELADLIGELDAELAAVPDKVR